MTFSQPASPGGRPGTEASPAPATPAVASRLGPLGERIALGGVLLLSWALRLMRVGDANLWWDEALAIWAVRKGLAGVTLWTAQDVHPPLYFWSLWGWVQATGESEFAMRILSVGFGLLTVAFVYALGKMVGGRRVGLLAALFIGTARFHVWWSQEMRMYVLAGLALTASLYFFLRWLRAEERSLKDATSPPASRPALYLSLAAYTLAALAAMYTVFLSAATLLVQNVVVAGYWLWAPNRRQRLPLLGRWAVSQALVGIVTAGWLLLSWGRMRSWSVAEPMPLRTFVRLYTTLLATGVSTHIERYTWALLPSLAVLAAGASLWYLRRRSLSRGRHLEVATLALALAIPALVVYTATMPRSLFYTPRVEARYLLPFAPPFWILLAGSVALIYRRWRPLACASAAGLIALSLWFLPGYYRGRVLRDELQSMVRTVASLAQPGDLLLLDSGSRYPIFAYYEGRTPWGAARPDILEVPPDDRPITPETIDALLREAAVGRERVWLAEVDVNLTDPDRLAQAWLAERYPQALGLGYGHNGLYLFDATGRPLQVDVGYRPQYTFDLQVSRAGGDLAGWEQPAREATPGDDVHVALLWERAPQEPVHVVLQHSLSGVALVQELAPPAEGGSARQQASFRLPDAFPSGDTVVYLRTAERDDALGTLRVRDGGPAATKDPSVRQEATFTGGLRLLGYRLHREVVSGERIPSAMLLLDLYWQHDPCDTCSFDVSSEALVVFAHLVGEAYNPRTEGPLWGQHDAPPMDGGHPVHLWRPGEVVVDRHVLAVDSEAPAGSYRLAVGLYRANDGARLPLEPGDADHVILETLVRVPERR